MSDDVKIPDEVLEAAKRLGLDVGEWGVSGEKPVVPGTIMKQRDLLLRLQEILKMQVMKDTKALAELREMKSRLEHGGGV